MFIWRTCVAALPTSKGLSIRLSNVSGSCGLCNAMQQDIFHALVWCPAARVVWEHLGLDSHLMEEWKAGCYADWWELVFKELCVDDVCRVAVICWAIWNARNEALFRENPREYGAVVDAALSYYRAFLEAQPVHKVKGEDNEGSWEPSPGGCIKVNCDAGFLGDGIVELGVVMRDDSGDVVGAVVKQLRANWEAKLAEAEAIRFALRVALHGGFSTIILESDCLGLIKELQVFQRLLGKTAAN